jgi:hypothetical protein
VRREACAILRAWSWLGPQALNLMGEGCRSVSAISNEIAGSSEESMGATLLAPSPSGRGSGRGDINQGGPYALHDCLHVPEYLVIPVPYHLIA